MQINLRWTTRALLPSLLALASLVQAASAQSGLVSPDQANFAAVGGQHEFNMYIGHSWHSGPALGYTRDTNFTTVVARWTYRIADYKYIDIRYAPEVTVLASLFENSPSRDDRNTRVPIRDNGGGFTPAAFEVDFLARKRIQPFFTVEGGMLFYTHTVLADTGTAFMFTTDIGPGVKIFVSPRNAVVLGFRYQHQSNADLGVHNPGADAELFTFGFSHFKTRGIR
jgi:hypothetical protein